MFLNITSVIMHVIKLEVNKCFTVTVICITRKPYGFMQSSFWVIMMVHVMVFGDL